MSSKVETQVQKTGRLNFTVDSALLRELGERLIGRPYIALAELVKNSYDADATRVVIQLDLAKKRIVVTDDGHGMSFDDFDQFWMRVGSKHKEQQRVSRKFKRQMTGSKGVGRIAVQYLAKEMSLDTVPDLETTVRIHANLNWEEAVSAGDLTKATVNYRVDYNPKGFRHGTEIILSRLKQTWTKTDVEHLAEEIWWLRPPFRADPRTAEGAKSAFEIKLISQAQQYTEAFERRLRAILDVWYARLVGKNSKGTVNLSLEFRDDESRIDYEYTIPDCKLDNGNFEIRIYHLERRQPAGIKVDDAREYLNRFGGVHVYDGGFHLPFYGDPKNDWLETEITHSHRLSVSKLLPKELNVHEGMTYLPTLSRIYGVVNVDTSKEPELKILITRDRFQENSAFFQLRDMVREALDFYAVKEKGRQLKETERKKQTIAPKLVTLGKVLDQYKQEIPEGIFVRLHSDIIQAVENAESAAQITAKQVGIMGSLATAGMTSVAFQHELRQELLTMEQLVKKLDSIKVSDEESRRNLDFLKADMQAWMDRMRKTNALFSYFANPDNIKVRERFTARKVVEVVWDQVQVFARGTTIDTTNIEEGLLLPEASLTEWSSIFQNVFFNAFNAMLDSDKRLIKVSSKRYEDKIDILIQDTGCGIDLLEADKLFEPFERRIKISKERQAQGYGGTGLGLTIVRLVADHIGCYVRFVDPEQGFSTAFCLGWRELG